MNVRKAVDYSAMFAALGFVMDADLPQMERTARSVRSSAPARKRARR